MLRSGVLHGLSSPAYQRTTALPFRNVMQRPIRIVNTAVIFYPSVFTTCANSAQCSVVLTHEATRTLIQEYIWLKSVSHRLDCCNSLLYGVSHSLILKVQSINAAA